MGVRKRIRNAVKRLPYARRVVVGLRALDVRRRELAAAIELVRHQHLEALQPAVPPGHYYSPIPARADLEARAATIWPDPPPRELPGIHLNEAGQLALLDAVARFYAEQPFADEPGDGVRYGFANAYFSYGDALYLYGLVRHLQPKRVIEVGSGYSSAVTLDTVQRFLDGAAACTFIEPEPDWLFSLLSPTDRAAVEIITQPVQDVPLARFADLTQNDILFIDGSHVAKTGSDVNHLLFGVLPRLRPGVYIHFHDIFYPFEYPLEWLEAGFIWNEAYVLRAFLMDNQTFEIALFGDYLARFHHDRLAARMPLALKNTGGSLWLRRM